MSEVDFGQLTACQRYKPMASLIVPRPLALVTTFGATGVVNAVFFDAQHVGRRPTVYASGEPCAMCSGAMPPVRVDGPFMRDEANAVLSVHPRSAGAAQLWCICFTSLGS
jgi:hypothetical protein